MRLPARKPTTRTQSELREILDFRITITHRDEGLLSAYDDELQPGGALHWCHEEAGAASLVPREHLGARFYKQIQSRSAGLL